MRPSSAGSLLGIPERGCQGRVPVIVLVPRKVTTEKGPSQTGDLLVSRGTFSEENSGGDPTGACRRWHSAE